MSTPLIAFNQEPPAHLLVNYLQSQSIEARIQYNEARNQFVVLLSSASDFDRAKQISEQFIRHPGHPRYQQAAWQNGEHVNLNTGTGLHMHTLFERARSAPFCTLILALCTLVFLLSVFGLFGPLAHLLMMQPLHELMQTHQWWRLVGPAFIHFSILHFVFNLLWWALLGSQIERRLGVGMLVTVFLTSAILSNVAQVYVAGPNFGGLSGVVYALMGFIWWGQWLKPSWGLHLQKAIIGFMLVWLVLGYFDVLWVTMANTAHTVGLATGCVLAWILSLGEDRTQASSGKGIS